MKSYKAIAEAAGTTVDVVREVAKGIYCGYLGWVQGSRTLEHPWEFYPTKSAAIEAAAKRKQAELDASNIAK